LGNLIIIGNGFDIAHDLATKFSDFMQYLNEFERPPQVISNDLCLISSISEEDQLKHNFYDALCKYIPEQELWSNFEEALNMIDIEEIKDNNSEFLVGYGDENWRDGCNHDYQDQISEELSFSSLIPKYFFEWISKLTTCANPIISSKIINNDCRFMNFNYTDTLEKTYSICDENILYIHGRALDNSGLIMGHNDDSYFAPKKVPKFSSQEETDAYYEECGTEDFRFQEAEKEIVTYFENTYKNVKKIITLNYTFFNSLSSIVNVYILGHSLSDIDLDYFHKIKESVLNIM
jgi:hypothetical protein